MSEIDKAIRHYERLSFALQIIGIILVIPGIMLEIFIIFSVLQDVFLATQRIEFFLKLPLWIIILSIVVVAVYFFVIIIVSCAAERCLERGENLKEELNNIVKPLKVKVFIHCRSGKIKKKSKENNNAEIRYNKFHKTKHKRLL